MVTGCTGVQTPGLYPYYPVQLNGLLGAIKGAAEYESLVNSSLAPKDTSAAIPAKYLEAQRRMGPQLGAHLLMIALIILGNIAFFAQRKSKVRATS